MAARLDLRVTPGSNEAVLVVLPGANGTADGYKQKYARVAEYINSKFAVTVMRTNWPIQGNSDGLRNFEQVMSEVGIRFANRPVSLMASSNSAVASAIMSYRYPLIGKMLLVNPPASFNTIKQRTGLNLTAAEVTVLHGSLDPTYAYVPMLEMGCRAKFITIPGHDHCMSQMDIASFIRLPEQYLFTN